MDFSKEITVPLTFPENLYLHVNSCDISSSTYKTECTPEYVFRELITEKSHFLEKAMVDRLSLEGVVMFAKLYIKLLLSQIVGRS